MPNSRSGGLEFESPVQQELGALTKKWKDPEVRSLYSGDHDVMSEHVAGCDHMIMSVCLAA